MKDKDKFTRKKTSGSTRARSVERNGSGSSARQRGRARAVSRSAKTAEQMEARFRAVFDNSRDAIGVSVAGVHVFVNRAYLTLFGFPPDTDLVGRPILDLVAQGSRNQVEEFTRRRVRGEKAPLIYETRGLRADLSEFDMEVSVSQYQESGVDHTLVILRDISTRKMSEEEIAERGTMLQQIMDTASVAIFLVDLSGRIIHANRRMAEMFGCTMEEIVGSEYVEHVHESERETGRQKMLALLASKIPSVDLERLYWRKDGTEFWGHLAGRRFHDVHGSELGLIGVITDIDNRKKAEQALKQTNVQLAASNKELDAIAYSVSHDLQAPLRSMSGFARILLEDYADKLDAQCNDYLVRILNGSEKMSKRIDALLHLSRISRQDIERTQINLSRIASSIADDIHGTNANRQVEIMIAEGLIAYADPHLIRVALSNLFDNAWKFTSKTPDARISFGSLDKEGKTLYFIKDNGVGFDPTYADKIFWPFHRLHSDTEFEGTGIGLAIVDRVIRRHGGKIWAEGGIGEGAAFYFTLD